MINQIIDIIVTGTGRSGTSFGSMCLQGELDVCMGKNLSTSRSNFHRFGMWEFKPFPVRGVEIELVDERKIFNALQNSHKHECNGTLTGLKAPFFSRFNRTQWDRLITTHKVRLVIWCWRSKEQVMHSKLKKYKDKTKDKKTVAAAARQVDLSLRNMHEFFEVEEPICRYVRVDFDHEVLPDEFVKIVRPFVEELRT